MRTRASCRRHPNHEITGRARIAGALFALALFSCADPPANGVPAETSSDRPAEPQTSPVAERTAQADTTSPEWTADIVRRDRAVSGIATQSAVRVARNEGFDRFVLEFEGDVLPSYHVEYVDRPVTQCGSGEVVRVAGDGWLLIRMEPARAHDDDGRGTLEQRSVRPALPILLEATLICDFEAQVEWILGMSSPNPYRVLELSRPARLVVDVRNN